MVMAYLTVLGTMPAYANSSFSRTATPIKHLVVIFQENVSFDHYFGTYPNAPIRKESRRSSRGRILRP